MAMYIYIFVQKSNLEHLIVSSLIRNNLMKLHTIYLDQIILEAVYHLRNTQIDQGITV